MKLRLSIQTIEENSIYRYSILGAIVGLLNLIWLSNRSMSNVLILFEVIILIMFMICRQYSSFLALFIMVTALSINISTYSGVKVFYGWNTVKFFRVDLAAWILVLFALASFIFKKPKVCNAGISFWRFTKHFLVICLIGVVVGLLSIALNDNNITNIDNYWTQYFAVVYIMAVYPLLIIYTTYYCKTREPESFYKVKASIIGVFAGCSAQAIHSLLTSTVINYAGVEGIGLAVSHIYFYIPLALCYFFYTKLNEGKIYLPVLIFISVGVMITIINNANGKVLLFTLFVPIVWCALFQVRAKITIPIAIIASIASIAIVMSSSDVSQNYLLSQKIKSVISLLNIFSENWLKNMSASPQFRVTEFLNTCIELLNKPWYLLTGKGYLGSIVDHLDMFRRIGGEFSDYQWNNGTFYFLHESLNLLLLNNGLMGLWLWIRSFGFTIRNYKKSFFVLFGGIWFCVNYGYSVALTTVGLAAFIIGLMDINQVQNIE